MSKNADTRIAEILQTCQACNCNVEDIKALMRKNSTQFVQQCSDAAGMGKHGIIGQTTKDKRALVRAIVFVRLLKRTVQIALASHQQSTLNLKGATELERILRTEFSVNRDTSLQMYWSPNNFTDPSNHNDQNYRYIIHGLQGNVVKVFRDENTVASRFDDWVTRYSNTPGANYQQGGVGVMPSIRIKMYQEYLRNPSLLKTDIISCSVIAHQANGTYTDFGFILRVPTQNVMLTSARDLAYKNRRGDQRAEIERYASTTPMQTPADIVRGMAARASGKSQLEKNRTYSEIVVLGTSPEGGQVQVSGLWLRVNEDGDAYSHQTSSYKPTVDDEISAHMLRCAATFNLPVVEISSPGGARKP